MALDISRYRIHSSKKITKTYPVPVDPETKAELDRIKAEYDFKVSAWIRDLILDHLPELQDELRGA